MPRASVARWWDREFESAFFQRRVSKLSVPLLSSTDSKRLGSVLAMIRDLELRRGPRRRSGPRRRDQRDARLFEVG